MKTRSGIAASKARSKPSGVKRAGIDLHAIDSWGVKRLASDSRRVKRGDTFVAYTGETHDGRRFIPQAIARGACAVIWEKRGFKWKPAWRVANCGVADLRAHAGVIASHVYGYPSARLWMVGVTGTNGKTTCSQWIARALDQNKIRSAVIGTLGYGMCGSKLRPLANTTPDAVWLHAQLGDFARRGAQAISMEVSSIGLAQDRVAGVQFDVALFTNLTRDHLDYHRTMRRYKFAKARLFEGGSLKYAIINLDDEFGAELAKRVKRRGLVVIGYGFDVAAGKRNTHVIGSNLVTDVHGLRFDVTTPWGAAHVESPIRGRFNASNLLGTLAALLASGVSLRKSVVALSHLAPIPGRMQAIGGGKRPLVIVDYAHTPDALEQVLRTLRELLSRFESRVSNLESKTHKGRRNYPRSAASKPRIFCVFGCGGERDRGKRPLMGRIAARLADEVVLTNDNPRNEDPQRIVDDILAGMESKAEIELDRRRAIKNAIGRARDRDVVLIAGKGHETYQEEKGVRHAFSDIGVARELLRGTA